MDHVRPHFLGHRDERFADQLKPADFIHSFLSTWSVQP